MLGFRLVRHLVVLSIITLVQSQTYLRAVGGSGAETYALINSVLGGDAVESPDCAHNVRHILQGNDGELKKQVFFFLSHVNQDNDGCVNFDRQRVEIKTYNPSPAALKGFRYETVSLSWNFKLDAAFQPSSGFTHIHQIKDVDGTDKTPILTLTPRYKASGNITELIHVNSKGLKTVLTSASLSPFLGKWVHVTEKLTYDHAGQYEIKLSLLSSGQTLLSYSSKNLDLWRTGASFVRPKWGIYRSLVYKEQLRDETVRFDEFCLGKGNKACS